MDSFSSHKATRAAQARRDVGAWFLFLPPYCADRDGLLNAYDFDPQSRRKDIRRPVRVAGQVCDIFSPTEGANHLAAAGYEAG